MGYPRVRIAPIAGWSGGLGVRVHGAFDGTVFQCCSPVGCEAVGLVSGSIFFWPDLGSSVRLYPGSMWLVEL